MADFDFDMLVIGSGPAGHHAAIQAAKLGKRVMLVERRPLVGGTCVNVGTIPSKTMREAVLYLSGYREHAVYGESYKVKDKITLQDLLLRLDPVVRHEIDVMRHQLLRNGVELVHATASFVDAHHVNLNFGERGGIRSVNADRVVVAVGTAATRDPSMPIDGECIYSSDDILQMHDLPQTLTVIGAGVIGCEYASIFAALGVRVTVVDKRPRLLPFVDAEIIEALNYHLRERRVLLRLGEEVSRVELVTDNDRHRVKTCLVSGKQIVSDKVLCSVGRTGATAELQLDAAGVAIDAVAASWLTNSFRLKCQTSTRWETWSGLRASRRPRWNRVGRPVAILLESRPLCRADYCRMGYAQFPKYRSSEATRKN
jgi:NAD(P) transhydrogenase